MLAILACFGAGVIIGLFIVAVVADPHWSQPDMGC